MLQMPGAMRRPGNDTWHRWNGSVARPQSRDNSHLRRSELPMRIFRTASRRYLVPEIAIVLAMFAIGGSVVLHAHGENWEVNFDGVDSAADNVPNYLRWDSPIDDDWDQQPTSYRLNTPSVGFMSVDRVTNPLDHGKTGNI